jgi:hypothetical protein
MLFLPFLTVSCSSPIGGRIGVEFSGWNSTLGTDPSVHGLNNLGSTQGESSADSTDTSNDTPALQRLTLIRIIFGWSFFGIVLVGTVMLLFMRSSVARSITAIVGSVLAGVVLVLNHVTLRSYVDGALTEASKAQAARQSDFLPDLDITNFVSVQSRWGLWVTLAYLGVFATANVFLLVYRLQANRMAVAPFAYVPPVAPEPPSAPAP